MNKKVLLAFLIGFTSFFASTSNAQISINFNVGSQPLWGPVGYDRADYYYMPDIDTYYSVPARQYVYKQNDKWLFSNALPSRHSGYNLYNGYKVVMNSPRPYLSYNTHKVKYAKYKGYKSKQPSIRYSNDAKYYVVKGHPKGGAPGHAKNAYSVKAKSNSSSGNGSSKGKHNGKGNGGGKGNGKGKN